MKPPTLVLLSRANLREGQRDLRFFSTVSCQLLAIGGGKNREARINDDFRAPLPMKALGADFAMQFPEWMHWPLWQRGVIQQQIYEHAGD